MTPSPFPQVRMPSAAYQSLHGVSSLQLEPLINLVRVRPVANSRRRTRLAPRLPANNRRDRRRPLGTISALGLEWLLCS
jgi:hypothetical protein